MNEIFERNVSESLQKTRKKFYEVAGHVGVQLKLQSRITYVRCVEVICTRQQNAILQLGQIWINQLKPFLNAFTNLLPLGQATIC